MSAELDVAKRNRVVTRMVQLLDRAAQAAWVEADARPVGSRLPALGLGIELARDQAAELLEHLEPSDVTLKLHVVAQQGAGESPGQGVRRLLARAEELAWSLTGTVGGGDTDGRCQRLHLDVGDLLLEAERDDR
jgi:hypothetical protein